MTEIYRDDQYVIDTTLDVPFMEHAMNIKEVAYGAFHKFLLENNLSKSEARRLFAALTDREIELQKEMAGLIGSL